MSQFTDRINCFIFCYSVEKCYENTFLYHIDQFSNYIHNLNLSFDNRCLIFRFVTWLKVKSLICAEFEVFIFHNFNSLFIYVCLLAIS